eukprot:7275464-Pyramimonas_sp.AAC.1
MPEGSRAWPVSASTRAILNARCSAKTRETTRSAEPGSCARKRADCIAARCRWAHAASAAARLKSACLSNAG